MELRLHANARTTPATRRYIQTCGKPVAVLSAELGVSETTIRRWRARSEVADRPHVPHTLKTSMSGVEEALAVELRCHVGLSLDDALEVMRRCVKPDLSRAALHRCWRRHGISARPVQARARTGVFETGQPAGFIHVDVKHLTRLNRQPAYAFIAIDRATRFVHLDIFNTRSAANAAAFFERFLESFPLKVHTVLSDNGSEFTDRFAVDKKGKPEDRPSGTHAFDRVCAAHGVKHRLTRPFRPQTNGMAERFNRRLQEHLDAHPPNGRNQGRNCFDTHEQRNAYIRNFVQNYNRTRLRCLGYQSPLEILNNLTEHNTEAGDGLSIKTKAGFRVSPKARPE
ncbi:transposase ISRme5 [Glycocaulis alkaliphilus]|uniref:Transposase ISRme5 n=1 Tax=Glycocaulis alkaliphilus TaxID=1434191 RepID=A0A3T0E9E6_9PROT|nr:DDE-type integrase/transposase/recombinase [Glycocaulis alkaliphilus]AZU03816.1 transposase ISRme5 [Glycocaulis alkaliphilus]